MALQEENGGNDTQILILEDPSDNSAELIERIHTEHTSVRCAIIGEPFLKQLGAGDLSEFWKALFRLHLLQYLNCMEMTDRSFHFLLDALRQERPGLKKIRLIGLTISNDESPLIPFVNVLSDIPTLESIHLNLSAVEGAVTNTSICGIFRSTHLSSEQTWTLDLVNEHAMLLLEVFRHKYATFRTLEVSGVDLAGIAVNAIAQILLHPFGALDKLHLSMQMLNEHANPIARALEVNFTLRELSILISGTPEMFRISPLAEALRVNEGLEWLQVSSHLIDDDAAQAFAEALKANDTLKVLDFSLDIHSLIWITDAGYTALLGMLQENHVLEMMPTYGIGDKKMQARIEYYLMLNDCGVRSVQLYENTTKYQFLHILAEQDEDDIDCIYYLLSSNPNVFTNESLIKSS